MICSFLRGVLLGVLLFVGLACGSTEPSYPGWSPPYPYHQIAPLPWYKQVWDSTLACVSETIPIPPAAPKWAEMRWFVMEGDAVYTIDDHGGYALAVSHFNDIYLGQHVFRLEFHSVLSHEIIHSGALIGKLYGWSEDHPQDPFVRCLHRMYPQDFQ